MAEVFTELVDAEFDRLDVVDKPANGTPFFFSKSQWMTPEQVADIVLKADMATADINDLPDSAFAYIESGGEKDESGRTTPRSLRHFPIHDAEHIRNALARASQSPYGDEALPKIRAAAESHGIEVTKTMPTLEPPDPTCEGNPDEAGSPAWESVDAATAELWVGILARASHVLSVLSEREYAEAGAPTGDPGDVQHSMDLCDAAAAVDYAVSLLAPVAAAERAASECPELEAIGKAVAEVDATQLGVAETMGALMKAGRPLSAGNEKALRSAVEAMQGILSTLPTPPAPPAADGPVVKAKPTMVPVFDARGTLVGVVDGAAVIHVEQPPAAPEPADPAEPTETDEAPEATESESEDDATEAPADTETGGDLTPAPPAEVGVSPKDVEKTINDLVKGAVDEYSAMQGDMIAKMAETITALQEQIRQMEEQPATPRAVTKGATPPPGSLRGQSEGDITPPANIADLRKGLYADSAAARESAATQMQVAAIDVLRRIHGS